MEHDQMTGSSLLEDEERFKIEGVQKRRIRLRQKQTSHTLLFLFSTIELIRIGAANADEPPHHSDAFGPRR